MKSHSCCRSLLFSGMCLIAVAPYFVRGQSTNEPSEVICGQSTNGVRAEIELVSLRGRLTSIVIWANHVADTNRAPSDRTVFSKYQDWDYFMATNCFCGPVQLDDSTGAPLPSLRLKASLLASYSGREFPLDPQVSSLNAYPETYSLNREHWRYYGRFRHGYSGPGIFPMPLFVTTPRSELVRFQISPDSDSKEPAPVPTVERRWFELGALFDIKNAGEYKLTVWPKIYKRSATNPDICQRLDLPPVSVTINWQRRPVK